MVIKLDVPGRNGIIVKQGPRGRESKKGFSTIETIIVNNCANASAPGLSVSKIRVILPVNRQRKLTLLYEISILKVGLKVTE